MRTKDLQMVPHLSFLVRQPPARMAHAMSRFNFDLLASTSLALLLVPALLYFDFSVAVALPLAVLIGLTSQPLFRLAFSPDRSDVFLPTVLFAVYFLIYFALRSFYLLTTPFFDRVGHNPYDDFIPAALWCACFGYIAFASGMASKIAQRWLRKLPAISDNWPRSLPAWRILFLMLVGLACVLYAFKIGAAVGDDYASREFRLNPPPGEVMLLRALIDMSWVAVCIFLVSPGRKSNRGLVWLLFSIALSILLVRLALEGGKEALIQPFFEAAIVFHYAKRRFRIWEMVIIGVPILMLAFGAVNFYRFVVVAQHGSPKNLADVISRVSTASDLLTSEHGAGTQESALEQMVERNAGADSLALIMKYTPHPFPYQYGQPWLEMPLTFIPRQIWKDKPVSQPTADFEFTYMGMPSSFNGFTSLHLIADLYRNFSFAGVLCGMFLFGVFLRFFYQFCAPCRENGTGLFLYAALLPQIIHCLESDAGWAMVSMFRAAALAIVAAVFLGARFRKVQRLKLAPRNLVLTARPRVPTIFAGEAGHREAALPSFPSNNKIVVPGHPFALVSIFGYCGIRTSAISAARKKTDG